MAITGIIEDGVRDKLLATAGVTTVLGQRVWCERAMEVVRDKENRVTKAYAVIRKEPAATDVENHAGGSTGMAVSQLMIAVYAETWATARNAAVAIRNAINATRGAFGNEWVSRCEVQDFMGVGAVPSRDDEVGVPGYGLAVEISYRIS